MNPQTSGSEIKSYRDLQVYQAAFELQQAVFRASKRWPRDEAFSLTDQIRRSSRSIGANLAEAWAKRKYPAHFLSKLSDSDGELQETRHWLDTALSCEYVNQTDRDRFEAACAEVGGKLGAMMARHEKFCCAPSASSGSVDRLTRGSADRPNDRSTDRQDGRANARSGFAVR